MKEIILTQGKVALIDDEDFERVSQFKWCANNQCGFWYAQRGIWLGNEKTKIMLMHRFILDAPKGSQVDHKNGDGLCNLRGNLRFCTYKQNQQNRRKTWGNSRFKGVHFNQRDKRWRAMIMTDGHHKFLGNYKLEEVAAKAYDKAALKYFGEFACTNQMIHS